jgi:phage terminase large subunit-like protein
VSAGRPAKTLAQRVADRSFVAHRHRNLLDGPLVSDPALREIQSCYQQAAGDLPAQRKLAREFAAALVDRPKATLLEQVREMSFAEFCRRVLGFELAAFQQEWTDELARLHPDGRRVYRLAVLGVGRGAGETWLSAALALFELLRRTDAPSVLLSASVKDQGELAYNFISRWVRASDELRSAVTLTKRELVVPETEGKLRVLSSLGDAAFGETPSVVVCDELHVWKKDQHHTLWEALVSGLGKRRDALMIAITTAPSSSASLLATVLDRELAKLMLEQRGDCLRVVRDEDAAVLTWWYGAPVDADLDDEDVWRRCTPQPWKTMHELRFERGALSDEAFSRLILNRPTVDDEDALIKTAVWDACRDDLLEPPAGSRIHIGIESSFGSSTCAVSWLWLAPDGRVVIRSRVFATESEPTAAHERTPGDRIDLGPVEGLLGELAKRFEVHSVAYDTLELRLDPQVLRDQYGLSVEPVRSGSIEQQEASRRLYALIENRELAHDGDPVLQAHMLGTRGRWDSHERLKVYRAQQHMKVDAWYATVAALAWLPDSASRYEDNEVRVLGFLDDDFNIVSDDGRDLYRLVDGERVSLPTTE